MSDYRWYKDTFLSKVTLREDGSSGFWKERFLAGLPKLFSEKVQQNLKTQFGNPLSYDKLTYGQIHNIIIATGLQVCNDFKLQDKMRKEKITNRKEVGNFCHQYGIETIRAPSTQNKRRIKKQGIQRTSNRKPPFRSHKKRNSQNQTRKSTNPRKKNVCWKCGKPGHYANKCTTQEKINNLEIDQKLKESLLNILINSEPEDLSSQETEYEGDEEDIINQLDNTSSSEESSEEDQNCLGPGLCNCNNCQNSVNMLTKDQTITLVSIIDKMEDSPLRNEFLQQLNILIEKDEQNRPAIESFSMNDIYNKFRKPKEQVTLKDLQEEIKNLKQ